MFEQLDLSSLLSLAAEGKLQEHKDAVVAAFNSFDKEAATAEETAEFYGAVRAELEAIKEAEATAADAEAIEAELSADESESDDAAEDEAAGEMSAEDDDGDEPEEEEDGDEAELSAEEDAPAEEPVAVSPGMISIDQVQELFELFQAMQPKVETPVAPTAELEAEIQRTIVDMSGRGQDRAEVMEQAWQGRTIELQSGEFSRDQLQMDLMTAVQNSHKGVDGTVHYLGTVKDNFDPEFTLTEDKMANFNAITASMQKHVDDAEAVTAAICCAPNDVIRDLVSYCRVDGVFTLPRISAPTGGLTYAIPSHACGLDVQVFEWKTECDPKAEPQPDKPCQEIECGKYEDVRVNAFGWCFEFCNEMEKFNPAQLEYYLAEAQCRFEHIVSQRLLSMLLTHPRVKDNVEACPAKGSSVAADLYEILSRKMWNMRKELCNQGLRLNIVAPLWVDAIIQSDNNRREGSAQFTSLASIASALNATVQMVDHWQCLDEDEHCGYPEDFDILIHVPGVFREIDGGEMNFGIVRDSVLNAQNRARVMLERWNGLAHFGPDCSSCILELSGFCPNGAVGPRVDCCAAE